MTRALLGIVIGSLFGGAARAQETRVVRTMTVELEAGADKAFPLFGPVREREWSPEWSPAFRFPAGGGQMAEGAVFTTGVGESETVWVMTDYDAGRGVVRYVVFRPAVAVTQIDIAVKDTAPGRSRAVVTYVRTSLGPAGSAALKELIDTWEARAAGWTKAINAALARAGGRQP